MGDGFFKENNPMDGVGNGFAFGLLSGGLSTNKVSSVGKDISIFSVNDETQADVLNKVLGTLSEDSNFDMVEDEKAKVEQELYYNLAYYDFGDISAASTFDTADQNKVNGSYL